MAQAALAEAKARKAKLSKKDPKNFNQVGAAEAAVRGAWLNALPE